MNKYILTSLERDELKKMLIEALCECPKLITGKVDSEISVLLTQKEVLKILGISMPTLLSWRKLGIINAVKINRSIRYHKKDIDNLLKNISTVKYSRNLNEVGL